MAPSIEYFSKRRALAYYLLLTILPEVTYGQSEVVISKVISYFDAPSVRQITWKTATERCVSLGMRLCMKKDICIYSAVSTSDVPRRFVERRFKHKYVPVGDAYNDWLYLGRLKSKQCQRITEDTGPPVWKGKGCKKATQTSNKFRNFCQTKSGFYCCRWPTKMAALIPYPVTVYIMHHEKNNKSYYSFSLNDQIDTKKSETSSEENNGISGELKTFSLMSDRVAGKFEDPIFFCSRLIEIENGGSVDHFYISNKWCNWGWKLNFYLYGSLATLAHSQRFEANAIGLGRQLRTQLSVNVRATFPAASFSFYGPKFDDGSHVKFYSNNRKMRCDKEPILLTSERGVISSRSIGTSSKVSCRWKIRAPSNSVVKIKFLRMDLKAMKETSTADSIKVISSQYVGRRLSNYDYNKICPEEKLEIIGYGQFCGNVVPPSFITIDNEIDVIFSSQRGKYIESIFALSYEVITPPNGLIRKTVHETSLTWTAANETCAAIGKSLCKASDICERTGGRPFYGIHEEDHWTPVSDEFNDWLQIGRGNVQTCKRHNDMFGPPLWGISESECNSSDEYIPCPKRDYLYCCNSIASSPQTENFVDVLVYTIAHHGTIFSKYIRKGIDGISSFDDMSVTWTRRRKERGDSTTIKLSSHYSPLFDKPLYFCQREVVPALERLRFAYSVRSQPCESQGWKYLYHLYAMSTQQLGTAKYYVGMYERRPHHSRIHSEMFSRDFESLSNFVFYSHIPMPIMADEMPVLEAELPACSGVDSIVTAPTEIISPGYPKSYKAQLDCTWIVKKPQEARQEDMLRLTVRELDLEDPVDILTIREVVDDNANQSSSANLQVRTFSGIVRQATVETTGFFKLNFKSDATVSKKGFRLNIDVISKKCGGEVRMNGDIITSPNYPSPYPDDSHCEWLIEAPSKNYNIEIQVISLDLGRNDFCSDKIILSSHHTKPITLCGNNSFTDTLYINGSTGIVSLDTSKSKSKATNSSKCFAFRVFFRKHRQSKKLPQCGVQSVPFGYGDPVEERIVGGSRAMIGNFPWMIHIEINNFYCAGTLISNSWILTAAHCVVKTLKANGTRILIGNQNKFKFIAGRHKRGIPNMGEQIRRLGRIVFHPDYAELNHLLVLDGFLYISKFSYNDIILLKMDKDIEFTSTIQPICLPSQDVHVGDTCYIAGWGDVRSDGTASPFLHYTKAPILENSLCNSYPLMRRTVFENALCAGYPAGGSGMCFGDSGGPLFCRGKYGNFYMNGVTSWSVGCARSKAPGVYTRVYKFLDWIKKVVADDSEDISDGS